MILSYQTLLRRLPELIGDNRDESLVNPASIDIRVGYQLEEPDGQGLMGFSAEQPYLLPPGGFVLVSTLERLMVPLDLAVELKLKSTRAREGYNHSLAFWFDPGWDGIGTMEISNLTKTHYLPLYPGLRIAQIIVHKLDEVCEKPYSGRYQGAITVECAKPEVRY